MKHLQVMAGVEAFPTFADEGPEAVEDTPGRRPELYDKPIEELDLSVRVFNSLKRTGITTIGDVLDMLNRGPDAMLAIRNFGEKSLDELVGKLRDKGYLSEETPEYNTTE
jgi:DNA-directed RNA polymerase subunit alpha